jgi:hypothetical protein
MEKFFEVMSTGFLSLQVLNSKHIKAGDEFYCDYMGGTWFDVITSDTPPPGTSSVLFLLSVTVCRTIICFTLPQTDGDIQTSTTSNAERGSDNDSTVISCGECGGPTDLTYRFLFFFVIVSFFYCLGGDGGN